MLPELIDTLLRRLPRTCAATRADLPETPRLALVDVGGHARPSPSSGSSAPPRAAAGIEALHATLDEVDLRRLDAARARASRSTSSTAARCSRTSTESDLVAAARDGRVCRRQPVPRAGGQQQEAVRAVRGPALRAPRRGRRGRRHRARRSRGRAILRAGPRHLRRLDDRPARRSSPTTASGSCSSRPPTTAATASRSAWRRARPSGTRIIEEHADRARLHRAGVRARCRRRCSRRSRTGTSRCA